jgi:spermidine synthase
MSITSVSLKYLCNRLYFIVTTCHSSTFHSKLDLDGDVIEACRDHFEWGGAWDDERVSLHVADGAAFVKNTTDGYYDVIVQDSSDPYTWEEESGEKIDLPSKTLYSDEHFENISRIIKNDGIFSFQAEVCQCAIYQLVLVIEDFNSSSSLLFCVQTFNIESDLEGLVEWRQRALGVGFEDSRYGSISISSYPTGQIGFLLCRKCVDSSATMAQIKERYETIIDLGRHTSYYQPKLHESAFALPLWVEKRIYDTK